MAAIIGRLLALLACVPPLVHGACPAGMTKADHFTHAGASWQACEDISVPGGALALVPDDDSTRPVWLAKTYEQYSPAPDSEYYLGLGKQTVLDAKWDMLGDAIVHACARASKTTGL